MTTQDVHQVGDISRLSADIIPKLIEEVDQVDRAAKRLSLTPDDKCDKCGQRLPVYCDQCGQKLPVPNKLLFRNSFPPIKAHEHSKDPASDEVKQGAVEEDANPRRGLRFWLIILALIVVGTVSALEGTIVGTALPTIVQDLGGAELYIWTVNGYFLTR